MNVSNVGIVGNVSNIVNVDNVGNIVNNGNVGIFPTFENNIPLNVMLVM